MAAFFLPVKINLCKKLHGSFRQCIFALSLTKKKMSKIFSEIFTTGKLPEKGKMSERSYKRLILAHALMAWAHVMCGAKPHENFGSGMAAVAKLLGVSATPDSLMKLSEKM